MINVQFVGLVCFYKEQDGGRRALFPDGRNPGGGIDKHYPRIIVRPEDVIGGDGWGADPASFDGNFLLPKCSVEIDGTSEDAVALDTSEHDSVLPSLSAGDPRFIINPTTADTVVDLPMNKGTLKAFRLPGTSDNDPAVALVSQLTVDRAGATTIRVKVKPDGNGNGNGSRKKKTGRVNGAAERTIVLREDAEIVIANVSDRSTSRFDPKTPSHYKIYERLSPDSGVTFDGPMVFSSIGVPRLQTNNPFFLTPDSIGLTPDCGNTGCCP